MTLRISLEEILVQHAPVATSQRVLAGRPSLLLKLEIDGRESWGEACPLPGFGDDCFELARRELQALSAVQVANTFEAVHAAFQGCREAGPLLAGPSSPASALESTAPDFSSASARHCFESAVMGAVAGSCGVPPWRLLAAEAVAARLATSAVVDVLGRDLWGELQAHAEQGISTFKLKCGRDLAGELTALSRLADQITKQARPEALRFRFDANGAWDVKHACRVHEAAEGLRVDWWEDPSLDLCQWEALAQKTMAPLALDEPLMRLTPSEAVLTPARVFVLKPMALGGWARCLRYAVEARRAGRSVSLSHFFDGPVALEASISLAFAMQSPEFAPGLGQHQALSAYLPHQARGLVGSQLVK